ncbi:hypothetical protein [Sphaerisporangium dianthi]|uniref:Uncharacterized protein n=1 Tax=Sphaerisporangium dianthi TaxID=1436120 RepID=A0ABV9CJB9_9ACTN
MLSMFSARMARSVEGAPGGGMGAATTIHAAYAAALKRVRQTHMKTVLRRASNTVNAHLTALDHFFTQLGLGPAVVRRDDAPSSRPVPWTPAGRGATCARSDPSGEISFL